MQPNTDNHIKSIVIVGGGSAGWMTAATLSSMLKRDDVKITLVESEEIGTVGVGEATIPDIINFNLLLGIDEQEFMKATNATFKLGIEFNNWGHKGDSYMHPFGLHGADMMGIDFHQFWLASRKQGNPLDIWKYSLETRGVTRIEGKVEDVVTHAETGDIESLRLQSGKTIEGEFFFDCTGFRSLLLSKTLGVEFENWGHWLPCDTAQAVACERKGPLTPYTKSTAKDAGWQWRIPTQTRVGNGHIYSSQFISDEDAKQSLIDDLENEPAADPRLIRFRTGCQKKFWEKNCIAVGLSAGFLEPLESTSLYLIQVGISRFISLFPDKSMSPVVREEYNRQIRQLFVQVRDFIILHYSATQRDDTPFWRYCRDMSIPDSLQAKIDLFKEGGRVFRYEDDLFGQTSWVAVMLGQNIIPKVVDPIAASVPTARVKQSLDSMVNAIEQASHQMPTHSEFIKQYCQSPSADEGLSIKWA